MRLLFCTTFILISVNSVLSAYPTDHANNLLKSMLDAFMKKVEKGSNLSAISTAKVKVNDNSALYTMNTTRLFKAINAKILNHMAIVQIVTQYNSEVHETLKNCYELNHGISLIGDLKDKLSGALEKLVVAYLTPIEVYLAKEIYNFFHGIGSDEYVLIDSLCIIEPKQKTLLKETYKKLYRRTIEDDLVKHTTRGFKKLILLSTTVERRGSEKIKIDKNPISSNNIVKHPADLELFATESFEKITVEIYNYGVRNNIGFKKFIAGTYTGDVQRAVSTIVNYSISPDIYYADRLYEIFKVGKAVDYPSLIRLTIMNRVANFAIIEEVFKRQYKQNKSLRNLIDAKIPSGPFKTFLDKLLGIDKYDLHRQKMH